MISRSLIIISSFFALFCSIPLVHAQSNSVDQVLSDSKYQSLLQQTVDIKITPTYPAPLDTVTVEVSSNAFNLAKSTITWLVDGVQKKQAVGERTFSTSAGKSGETRTIGVVVFSSDGQEVRKAVSFTPENVDLILEPIGYTPPFYKGKTLFARQGIGSVVALPQIITSSNRRVPAKDLLYTWTIDNGVDGDASGVGNSRYFFPAKVPNQATLIKVDVSTLDGSIHTQKSLSILPGETKTIVYRDDPLYGVLFNQAVFGEYPVDTAEVRLVAMPYFFSTNSAGWDTLSYTWRVGGRIVESTTGQKQSILFRNESGKTGTVPISVHAENSERIFQFGDGNFSTTFTGNERETSNTNNTSTF